MRSRILHGGIRKVCPEYRESVCAGCLYSLARAHWPYWGNEHAREKTDAAPSHLCAPACAAGLVVTFKGTRHFSAVRKTRPQKPARR